MIGESILELHETNATDESIKSYEYDEYQPITGTQLNNAGKITITVTSWFGEPLNKLFMWMRTSTRLVSRYRP